MSDSFGRRDFLAYGTVFGAASVLGAVPKAHAYELARATASLPIDVFAAVVETFAQAPDNEELRRQTDSAIRRFEECADDLSFRERATTVLGALLRVEPRFLELDRAKRRTLLKSLQFAGDPVRAPVFTSFEELKAMLVQQTRDSRGSDLVGPGPDPWSVFQMQADYAKAGYREPPRLPEFTREDLENQRLFQELKLVVEYAAPPRDSSVGYVLED